MKKIERDIDFNAVSSEETVEELVESLRVLRQKVERKFGLPPS